MRRGVRLLTAIAAAVALVLFVAGQAAAGGPTSVILVGPSERHASALYNSDADYAVLLAVLEAEPEPDPDGPPLHRGQPGGTHVNATWLIHDIRIWRIDHIFVTASRGPWIQTHIGHDDKPPEAYGDGGIWHRSPHPEQLLAMLHRAGFDVPGGTSDTRPPGPTTGTNAEPKAAADEFEPADAATSAVAGSFPGSPAVSTWWVPVALVVGVLLGASGRAVVGAIRRWRERVRTDEPRRETT